MRIALVGLGDIARKAYLPLLAARPGLELHLVTRNPRTLATVGDAYRLPHRHTDLADALRYVGFDAAFVHAATAAHPMLVEQLIRARVPVFVDKPLADTHAEAARLAALADAAGVPLMVGFNRRFAPVYADLREQPRSSVRMAKHRRTLLMPPRVTIFDDFIHIVDTLRFLLPEDAALVRVDTVERSGNLAVAHVTLANDGMIAVGTMNRDSGLDQEELEVIGGGARTVVSDMAEVIVARDAEQRARRGDWTSVARQRGFEAMCDAFLDTVAASRCLPLDDMLETHRLCEVIVRHAEHRA